MTDFGMNLWVIDEKDRVLQVLSSEEIHKRGLPHRVMHVTVNNDSGEFYVWTIASKRTIGGLS